MKKKKNDFFSHRCLDLGLRNERLRDVFLSEGLLEAALAVLQPDVTRGAVGELIESLSTVADGNASHSDSKR